MAKWREPVGSEPRYPKQTLTHLEKEHGKGSLEM